MFNKFKTAVKQLEVEALALGALGWAAMIALTNIELDSVITDALTPEETEVAADV